MECSGLEHLFKLIMRPNDNWVKPEKLPGVWAGQIEWVNDPIMVSRVRVRIPLVHGDSAAIPTENLPIAEVLNNGGGLEDEGSVTVYRPGMWVWVMFIMGEEEYPIVVGKSGALPVLDSLVGTSVDMEGKQIPSRDPAMGSFPSRRGHEFPREWLGQFFADPSRHIQYKTTKGASLVIEEQDGLESTEMLDRGGQGLRMRTNIKTSENVGNASRRGLKSVFRKSGLDPAKTVDDFADIEVVDLGGQSLKLKSKLGDERIKLTSHAIQDRLKNEGNNCTSLDLDTGDQKVMLKIKVDGEEKGRILIDTIREEIDVKADYRITLDSSEVIIRGKVRIEGDLEVEGDSRLRDVLAIGEVKELGIEKYPSGR